MASEDRKLAIEYLEKMKEDYIEGEGYERYPLAEWYVLDDVIKWLEQESCDDCVNGKQIFKTLNEMDRYIANELILCENGKKFPRNEVFIVDDVYEKMEELLSVAPAPARSTDDKYKEVAMDVLTKYLESEQSLIAEYSGNYEESAMTLKKQVMPYLKRLGEDEDAFYELVKDLWIADYYEKKARKNENE